MKSFTNSTPVEQLPRHSRTPASSPSSKIKKRNTRNSTHTHTRTKLSSDTVANESRRVWSTSLQMSKASLFTASAKNRNWAIATVLYKSAKWRGYPTPRPHGFTTVEWMSIRRGLSYTWAVIIPAARNLDWRSCRNSCLPVRWGILDIFDFRFSILRFTLRCMIAIRMRFFMLLHLCRKSDL